VRTMPLLVLVVPGVLAGSLLIFSAPALSQQSLPGTSEVGPQRDSLGGRNLRGAAPGSRPQDRSKRERRGRRGGRGMDSRGGPAHVAQTDVPARPVDVILGRPTNNSVTMSVLAYVDMRGKVSFGTQKDQLTSPTSPTRLSAGEPSEFVIDSLQPATRYYYQFAYQDGDSSGLVDGTFHTQRPRGSSFVFTIQADSHLDQNTSPDVYANTLRNVLADGPDFHVDLGDTFMTGKYQGDNPTELYLAQRYYFGLLCHSAPLFLVLGNHDGEPGGRGLKRTGAVSLRKEFFPNPEPDAFYTGNRRGEEAVGLLQDYYAWEWGDALFVVLDPFWYSARPRGERSDNWYRTLGEDQYRWLRQSLEASQARFKFVFVHHLVGGSDSSGRGGAEAAKFFEWGGHNRNGRYEFDARRPGWGKPIHQLLVENNVSVVFHGHDHFFAKQDLDGVVYQLVPQPAHARYGNPRTAAEYGYVAGDILGGSGHVRVTVTPNKAKIDYILSVLPSDETVERRNRIVAHTYVLDRSAADEREERPAQCWDSPAHPMPNIDFTIRS
jgi:hypothetical protein